MSEEEAAREIVRRYTDEAKCPKCFRHGFAYDKGAKAWVCLLCRYRDR